MKTAQLTLIFAIALILVAGSVLCETLEDIANQVRSTEIAFAKSMADRNLEAFSKFLADEALFFDGPNLLRGKDAIASSWSSFFEGDAAPFSWEPEMVEVLDSGQLAFSTGPVWSPDGKQVGTFNSIWRREADGSWKVVFDKGCPHCN